MPFLWPTEILINIILQNLGIWLSPIMHFFSFLGNQNIYVIVIPLIYWCYDSGLAMRFIFLLSFSVFSNTLLKVTFHGTRPYWFDQRVSALSSEYTFGIPSGHSQHAASVWSFLGLHLRKRWGWFLVISVIFLIGLSRMYLGVHFLSDVIIGWLFGIFFLFLFMHFEKHVLKWVNRFSLWKKTFLISIICLCILILGLVYLHYQSQFLVPQAWISMGQANPNSVRIDPYSSKDFVSLCGVFWGFFIGNIWLNSRINFQPRIGSIQQKGARYFFGLIGIMIILYGMEFILQSPNGTMEIITRFFRYGLASLWISGLSPFVFKRFKLL